MKFQVNMDVEVADHDADVMLQFPQAVLDRFAGTAIKITDINVNKRAT